MVQINFAAREVNCKVVYYGPGRSGKTTNLEIVHAKAPKDSIGELISIATETDRTLYFDFLPLDLGKVAGMTTKFQLYTVPGQVFYNATRKLVLQGADGVVFVADSHPDMMAENIESVNNLEQNLRENGLDIAEIPLVFQWNKRDLPNVTPTEELNAKINRWNAPGQEAVAVRGEGVFPTLKALTSMVIRKLNQDHVSGRPKGATPAPRPAGAGVITVAAAGAAPAAKPVPMAKPAPPRAMPPRPAALPPRPPVRTAPAAPSARPAPVAAEPPSRANPAPPRPAVASAPTPAPRPAPAPAPAPRAASTTTTPPRPAPAPQPSQSGTRSGARPAAPPPADRKVEAAGDRSSNPVSEEIRRRKERMAQKPAAGGAAAAAAGQKAPAKPLAKPIRGRNRFGGLWWALLSLLLVLVLLAVAMFIMARYPDLQPEFLPKEIFKIFEIS
jgi:signal recognition particle receptor subunit beta